jgi:hypothetical protein
MAGFPTCSSEGVTAYAPVDSATVHLRRPQQGERLRWRMGQSRCCKFSIPIHMEKAF